MPLSKPVKKQQLILPSPYDFYRLPFEKKETILKRLSTDNLLYYLEHIVNAFHDKDQDHRNRECFTLEQILEEDVRGSGGGAGSSLANNAVFINNWLKQNANPDLAASFLEQHSGGFNGMTSTKKVNQTLLGPSQQQSMMKASASSADYHRRFNSGGGGGSFNMNSMSAALPSPVNQNQLYSSGLAGNRGGNSPSKNIWDSVPANSPSGNSRWQNSSGSNAYGASGNSLSLSPFRLAIERPLGLDLRNGTETPVFFHSKVSLGPNQNASINANISGGYQQQGPANAASSGLSSMSLSPAKGKLDPNYTPDYFNMSANSSSASNRAKSLWDNPEPLFKW